MNYRVHVLELRKAIEVSADSPLSAAADGTLDILSFRSLVPRGSLEPAKEDHLVPAGLEVSERRIPEGTYLFTQAPYPADPVNREGAYRDAAEAIWLESLWKDLRLKNDRILARILSEDDKTVFQIFREIEKSGLTT